MNEKKEKQSFPGVGFENVFVWDPVYKPVPTFFTLAFIMLLATIVGLAIGSGTQTLHGKYKAKSIEKVVSNTKANYESLGYQFNGAVGVKNKCQTVSLSASRPAQKMVMLVEEYNCDGTKISSKQLDGTESTQDVYTNYFTKYLNK